MGNDNDKSKNTAAIWAFWGTIIAALITAIVTLIVAGKIPPGTPTETPALLLEPIAGIWSGMDEGTVGGDPVSGREVEVTILADCSIGNICGTATTLVNNELCYKNLILIEIQNETFKFEGRAKEGSGAFCGEGGSITLKPLQDGTLSYALDSINSTGKIVNKIAILNLRK